MREHICTQRCMYRETLDRMRCDEWGNKRGAYRKRNHKKAVDGKYYIQRQSYSEEEGNIPQIL